MSEHIIITGIEQVERMFIDSPKALDRNLQLAVAVNARKVQLAARRLSSGHPRWVHYPRTITYDVTQVADRVEAEIGPDKSLKGQAPYGAIVEFGTPRTAPIPHLAPALEQNADDLERGISIAVMQALGMA